MQKVFGSIIAELKKTKWPTKIDTLNLTIYVIAFCGALALIMVGLDVVFAELRNWFLNI